MTKAKIVKISKDKVIKTGERFLNVEVEIVEGTGKNKITEKVIWGYPLDTSSQDIEKDIKKHLKNRKEEAVMAEKEAIAEAEEKQADDTIETLSALEVTEE